MEQASITPDPVVLHSPAPGATIEVRQRVLLMAVRQALIIALGALEDYLDLPRSVMSARERRRFERSSLT